MLLGLLVVLAACGCVGEKKENVMKVQTVRMSGATADYDLSVVLPEGFNLTSSSSEPTSIGTVTSGSIASIGNKNLKGSFTVALMSINEPDSQAMLDTLFKLVSYGATNALKWQYANSSDVKFSGHDGREWHYTSNVVKDGWFIGVPLDNRYALLITSSHPKNVTDQLLATMEIKPVAISK